jgi:hypothetical protein
MLRDSGKALIQALIRCEVAVARLPVVVPLRCRAKLHDAQSLTGSAYAMPQGTGTQSMSVCEKSLPRNSTGKRRLLASA